MNGDKFTNFDELAALCVPYVRVKKPGAHPLVQPRAARMLPPPWRWIGLATVVVAKAEVGKEAKALASQLLR